MLFKFYKTLSYTNLKYHTEALWISGQRREGLGAALSLWYQSAPKCCMHAQAQNQAQAETGRERLFSTLPVCRAVFQVVKRGDQL